MDQLFFLFQDWLGNVFRTNGKGWAARRPGFLNIGTGCPVRFSEWLWKQQPSFPTAGDGSYVSTLSFCEVCTPHGLPRFSQLSVAMEGGGGRRWSGIWVEIIPRRIPLHWGELWNACVFSRPFLSWVSRALLGSLGYWESVVSLTQFGNGSCGDTWLFFFSKSLCMKQTEIQNSQPVSICERASAFNLTPSVTV